MLVALVALAASAAAFSRTAPLLAWSYDPACPLRDVQTNAAVMAWDDVMHMLPIEDLCCHTSILLVEHHGLHASDLQLLHRSTELAATLRSSSSLLQIPRLTLPATPVLETWIQNISSSCGHVVVHDTESNSDKAAFRPDTRYLIRRPLPVLTDADASSPYTIKEDALSDLEQDLTGVFPSRLVILFGPSATTGKRQVDGFPAAPLPFLDSLQIPPNGTRVNTPLLSRFQILTPGLISALLVVFVVFLPILLVGVSSLASIQSPIKMDAPKGPSAEKKHQ